MDIPRLDPTGRSLGRGGPAVSRLGLGLAALGRPGYLTLGHAEDLDGRTSPRALEAATHEVLDTAWEHGVRYFDVARSYGRGEDFLASWIAARGLRPGQAVVGSKWGYTYMADWRADAPTHEVKDHSLETLERQWGETQQRLGAHLTLWQVHSATWDGDVLENHDVMEELARLKATRGVRIGLTVSGPRQAAALRRALAIEYEGECLFDVVQATWNLLEPSAGPALREAWQQGLGIIIKEPLANGRLTDRNEEDGFEERLEVLEDEAFRLGASLDALALAAALAQPFADVVLSGAATPSQLRSNLRATEVPWDAAAVDRLAELAEAPEDYWAHRATLPWT